MPSLALAGGLALGAPAALAEVVLGPEHLALVPGAFARGKEDQAFVYRRSRARTDGAVDLLHARQDQGDDIGEAVADEPGATIAQGRQLYPAERHLAAAPGADRMFADAKVGGYLYGRHQRVCGRPFGGDRRALGGICWHG